MSTSRPSTRYTSCLVKEEAHDQEANDPADSAGVLVVPDTLQLHKFGDQSSRESSREDSYCNKKSETRSRPFETVGGACIAPSQISAPSTPGGAMGGSSSGKRDPPDAGDIAGTKEKGDQNISGRNMSSL